MYLNKLANDYSQVIAMMEDSECDDQIFADTLESIQGEMEERLDAYAVIRAELIGDLNKLKPEIERLTKLKKSIEANIERLESSIDVGMKTLEKEELKTDLYRFHYKKNPAKVVIKDNVDISQVPVEFLKFTPPEIKKTEVKNAIKNGQEFEWAYMVQEVVLKID